MKLVVCAIALIVILSVAAAAAEPVKVSITASDQMLSAVVADMSKQAGANIIVDPKCRYQTEPEPGRYRTSQGAGCHHETDQTDLEEGPVCQCD